MEVKNRLLSDVEIRQFRVIANEMRQDRCYWDMDEMLKAQDAKTLRAIGEWLIEQGQLPLFNLPPSTH